MDEITAILKGRNTELVELAEKVQGCMIVAGQMETHVKHATKKKAPKTHRLYQCPCCKEVRSQILEELGTWEQRARTSKRDWKWLGGIATHPLSESKWVVSHFSVRKWESDKHKSWGSPS